MASARTMTAAALACVAALAGCSSAGGSTGSATDPGGSPDPVAEADSRLGTILRSGEINVCTTGDYRPFTYLKPGNGGYVGIDIAMVENLAESLDASITWVPTTWDTLEKDFVARCDIAVGGISVSTDRAAIALYSDPLLEEGKTPITRCENVTKYDTIAEINRRGVRSITPIGGTNEEFADEHYPRGTIIRWDDNNTIFDEILAGRADVMTTDASETVWVAENHPGLCAVHPNQPFDYSQKAYMLPQGDVTFKAYVDTWLNIAKHDGTWREATRAWFGDARLN